jgi:tRNA threonylcarbamoyladenosine biosynthesis protein TsaB
MMRVLALDTTTRAGSVALVEDDRVIEERAGDSARTHAERLPREVQALLEGRGLRSADVDLFAVASGPGSFTGLRIGIATMQGFAFVHRRRIVPVSALEALAWTVHASRLEQNSLVAAWMDAHRRDVFSALYRLGEAQTVDAGALIEVEGPQVGDPGATLERWDQFVGRHPLTVVGDGASRWADVITGRYADARIVPHPLLAGAVGRIASVRAAAGAAIEPASVRPLYVRRPDAVIERDRRAGNTKDTKDTKDTEKKNDTGRKDPTRSDGRPIPS